MRESPKHVALAVVPQNGLNWRRIAFWSLLFLFVYIAPTEGQAPISVVVSPHVLICPLGKTADVRVLVRIVPHKDNRQRTLSWTSPVGQSGGSQTRMDGEEDASTFERFVPVSPGDYVFLACVVRVSQGKAQTLCANERIEVR